MQQVKERLWHEIETLPEHQMQAVFAFIQFLRLEPTQSPNLSPRRAGLDAGSTQVADDFDDPLPDSFWLGEDDETLA